MTNLGSVIFFSAAIPYQGGTNHVNEQWPEYWENLFKNKGYVPIDCLRNKIWDNDKIEWWYRQNIMFFVNKNKIKDYPRFQKELGVAKLSLSRVHPKCYIHAINKLKENTNYTQYMMNITYKVCCKLGIVKLIKKFLNKNCKKNLIS